jgi:ABC-type arginine transport system ATPase subunit
MKLIKIRNRLEQEKGKRIELENDIRSLRIKIRKNKRLVEFMEEAREIIRIVGIETQKQLQYHISDIASLALESIFENPYKLILEFLKRRNKIECDILFERDEIRYDEPLENSGGGTIDVATYALRIASWSMERPQTRNIIILDEPLKNVSTEYQELASEMLKEVADKLNIQFIIVTHNTILTTYADRVFETNIRKDITNINSC